MSVHPRGWMYTVQYPTVVATSPSAYFHMSRKSTTDIGPGSAPFASRKKKLSFWTHIEKKWAPGPAGSLSMSTFLKWFHWFRGICEHYRLRPDAAWSPNKPREQQWRMIPRWVVRFVRCQTIWVQIGRMFLVCDLGQTVCLCQVPTNEGQHKSKWKSIHVDASYASSLTIW